MLVRAAIARPLLDQDAVAVIGAAKAGSLAIPPRSNLAQAGHRPGRAGQRPGYRTAAARAPVAGTPGEPIYPDAKVDFRLRPPAMCMYVQSADPARIRLPPLAPGGDMHDMSHISHLGPQETS